MIRNLVKDCINKCIEKNDCHSLSYVLSYRDRPNFEELCGDVCPKVTSSSVDILDLPATLTILSQSWGMLTRDLSSLSNYLDKSEVDSMLGYFANSSYDLTIKLNKLLNVLNKSKTFMLMDMEQKLPIFNYIKGVSCFTSKLEGCDNKYNFLLEEYSNVSNICLIGAMKFKLSGEVCKVYDNLETTEKKAEVRAITVTLARYRRWTYQKPFYASRFSAQDINCNNAEIEYARKLARLYGYEDVPVFYHNHEEEVNEYIALSIKDDTLPCVWESADGNTVLEKALYLASNNIVSSSLEQEFTKYTELKKELESVKGTSFWDCEFFKGYRHPVGVETDELATKIMVSGRDWFDIEGKTYYEIAMFFLNEKLTPLVKRKTNSDGFGHWQYSLSCLENRKWYAHYYPKELVDRIKHNSEVIDEILAESSNLLPKEFSRDDLISVSNLSVIRDLSDKDMLSLWETENMENTMFSTLVFVEDFLFYCQYEDRNMKYAKYMEDLYAPCMNGSAKFK